MSNQNPNPNRNNSESKACVDSMEQRESHPNCRPSSFLLPVYVIRRDWQNNGPFKFILVSLGVFMSLISFGVLEEKLMQGCYGEEDKENCPQNKKFKYATTIVGSQMLCAFIIAKILDVIKPEEKDETPILYYVFATLFNAVSMITCVLSLRWVSYPVEIVFKSARPVAVMLSNLLVCKRYPIQKYFFVLIIVVGVLIFKLFEPSEKNHTEQGTFLNINNWERFAGIGLLIVSLCMDGILGTIQDRVRDRYSPTFRQMMSSMTGYMTATTAIIVTATGEIVDVFNFVTLYPIVMLHLVIISIAGAIGQLFIFIMLTSFGALATSVVTTVRKLFTIVFSILFYGNPSTSIQWIGAAMVFSALLADAFFSNWKSNQAKCESGIDNETNNKRSAENEGNNLSLGPTSDNQ